MPLLPSFLSGASASNDEQLPAGESKINVSGDAHLKGHVGHLTAEQQDALDRFKALLVEKGIYRAGTKDSLPTHDDATLLRFLRARQFDINAAFVQLKDSDEWTEKNQLSWLYNNIEVDDYEEARRMYPSWTGRRDKRGIPVHVYRIADLNAKAMKIYESNTSTPAASPYQSGTATPVKGASSTNAAVPTAPTSTISPKLLRLFALYQNMESFLFPLCTALPRPNMETPISSTANICDITGVGLMQFWNLKNHMQEASVLATAHFPETLDRIYIVGAPSFFPTVWGWIKKWFDPVTTSKIYILSSTDAAIVLRKYVDPDNLPIVYGGNLAWEFGQDPVLDDEAKQLLGMQNGWIPGPITMTQDVLAGEMVVEAVGSEKGKQRKDVITKFPVEISSSSAS